MSNSTATCLSDPPPSLLPNITACQSTATTPFCWPTNGTRICVPAPSGVPFFWPPSYYPASSRVLLEWDLSSNIFPVRENAGNTTQSITKYMYEQYGLAIPSAPENERSLKMYMRSKVENEEMVNHEGPTIVLVKTAEFTSASSRPTGTGSPTSYRDDDDKDPLSGLTSGAMAGIIVGILVAVVGIVALSCCCGCCACCGVKPRFARKQRVGMDQEEHSNVVARGVELMEQKGGSGGARMPTLDPGREVREEEIGVASTTAEDGLGDEIRRVGLNSERERADPPPRYTP